MRTRTRLAEAVGPLRDRPLRSCSGEENGSPGAKETSEINYLRVGGYASFGTIASANVAIQSPTLFNHLNCRWHFESHSNQMSAFDPLRTLAGHALFTPMKRDEDRLSRAWSISERRGETLMDDIQFFLADLCKGHGFCSALPHDILAGGEPLTAEAFAIAVMRAEGWPDPSDEYTFRPDLMKLFKERYGASVSASTYKR